MASPGILKGTLRLVPELWTHLCVSKHQETIQRFVVLQVLLADGDGITVMTQNSMRLGKMHHVVTMDEMNLSVNLGGRLITLDGTMPISRPRCRLGPLYILCNGSDIMDYVLALSVVGIEMESS